MILILAALSAAMSATPVTGPLPEDAPIIARVDSTVVSTTRAWTAAFQNQGLVYVAPRVIYLRLPLGHPGRGSGYARTAGLIVDLDEIKALDQALGSDAMRMESLIIAHEIGHNVQYLTERRNLATPLHTNIDREIQADCYAGWWLGRSPGGPFAFTDRATLTVKLSRTLQVLDVLEKGGVTLGRDTPAAPSHGRLEDRVLAISRGLALTDPWLC